MTGYVIKCLFDTIQGEGGRAGARSVFVRFVGCNLWSGLPADRERGKGACARWCDTDFVDGRKITAEELEAEMADLWPASGLAERWCVLSGGEPMLQVDEVLVRHLHRAGWKIAIETNGTLDPPLDPAHPTGLRLLGQMDWVTVSPKRNTLGGMVVRRGSELKVVLPGDQAQPWTTDELCAMAGTSSFPRLYVQPQDIIDPAFVEVTALHRNIVDAGALRRHEANVERCVEFVMAHPAWRLSLQTHKFINVP